MQIKSRLEKLEKIIKPRSVWDEWCEHQMNCTHPRGMFHVRRDYPWWNEPGGCRTVIFGHCDSCAYDAPLFSLEPSAIQDFKNLPGPDDDDYKTVAIELLKAGKIFHTPFPTNHEEEQRLCSSSFEDIERGMWHLETEGASNEYVN